MINICIALCGLVVAAPAAAANLPLKINFQGRLTDPTTQEPRNGPFEMTFRIYDGPEGGAASYVETQDGVPVSNGVFSVQIGSSAALSPDLFQGASAYLSVQVAPDGEMTPRQALNMSPYAFSAAQLVADGQARVRVDDSYSTFTSAGHLLLAGDVRAQDAAFAGGVTATSGTFTAVGSSQYGVETSSGLLVRGGTLRVRGPGGVNAEYGVRAGSVTAAEFFQAGAPATEPGLAPIGGLRAYYDDGDEVWRVSVNGRAYSVLGRTTTTLWNTNATTAVGNQGQNLPAALTELDSATQGARMIVDCDEVPAQVALRYNFRTLQNTSLSIELSVRDVTNTANVLATVTQPVNAVQNWIAQGAYADKPGWCTGTQVVAVYTAGGNGTLDAVIKHVVLVGRP